jgi:signal transduction histidine kinase
MLIDIKATMAALALVSVIGLIWLVYRNKLRHLLEVERIRTRIAADLHDDIGASLSRISILSEVVKSRLPAGQDETAAFLTEIADSSRELVDSMSEIVWSIDPRRDNLKHLLARVGQFANGVLEAKGIRWTMSIPPHPGRIKLTPEQRRDTYLILKEAINNAMKHSGCHSVNLLVELGNGLLVAQVRDDGTGLPPEPSVGESSSSRRGRGLIGMHIRAKEMGAHFMLTSSPEGTVVRLELPHGA